MDEWKKSVKTWAYIYAIAALGLGAGRGLLFEKPQYIFIAWLFACGIATVWFWGRNFFSSIQSRNVSKQ